jgi:hypothetical protein
MSRASCIFIFKTSLHFANKRRDEGGKNKEAIVREKAGEIQTGAFDMRESREWSAQRNDCERKREAPRRARTLLCTRCVHTLSLEMKRNDSCKS